MSPIDSAIAVFNLLGLLDKDEFLTHQVKDDTLQVWVTDLYAAEKLWRKFNTIAPLHLEIYVGLKQLRPLYSTKIKPKSSQSFQGAFTMPSVADLPNRSLFAQDKTNLNLLRAIPHPWIIYEANTEADPDNRYRAKYLQYPLHPKQFNKPPEELLADGGKPVSYWDECIAVPRIQAIEEAIATGNKVVNEYENLWQGFLWRLKHEVYPLPNYNEVLVVVSNQENCEWQSNPELWFALQS